MRDRERVVKGSTEDVWGGKVEGRVKGGTASRKPDEITDNGPGELGIWKNIRYEGKKNVSTSARGN